MNIILFDKDTRHFDCSDERFLHIRKVLRLKEGDSFIAGEYDSFRGEAVITSLTGDGLDFTFHPYCDDSELNPLTMILAMVRPICMKRILRELASMGLSRLILVKSDLGEKSYQEAGLYTNGEYRGIVLSGAMQGGHTGIMKVSFASCLEEALEMNESDTDLLLDNVIGSKRFCELDLKGRVLTIAVGSERGWSAREREVFLTHSFIPVKMGDRILRSETAAVASSALALEAMGII